MFVFTLPCIPEAPHTQPPSVMSNGHILVHLILIAPLSKIYFLTDKTEVQTG